MVGAAVDDGGGNGGDEGTVGTIGAIGANGAEGEKVGAPGRTEGRVVAKEGEDEGAAAIGQTSSGGLPRSVCKQSEVRGKLNCVGI